jgi:hypothetical protein
MDSLISRTQAHAAAVRSAALGGDGQPRQARPALDLAVGRVAHADPLGHVARADAQPAVDGARQQAH